MDDEVPLRLQPGGVPGHGHGHGHEREDDHEHGHEHEDHDHGQQDQELQRLPPQQRQQMDSMDTDDVLHEHEHEHEHQGWRTAAFDSKPAQWLRRHSQRGSSPGSRRMGMAISWGKYNPIRMQYLKERESTPQRLWLQLLGKSYVGLIYWTALVEFLRNLFWFQLKAGGLAPQLGFLAYLFIPSVAVGRSVFREFLEEHPWSRALLVVGGVLGIWGELYHSAIRRVTLSACGVGLLGIYMWEGMWAASTARRERTAFGMVGGILLLQVFRWAYGGPNPLVANFWCVMFLCIVPGVGSALLVLCEDLAESEGEQLESFIEEDEDIELDHIEVASVPSDGGGDGGWRYKRVEVMIPTSRSTNNTGSNRSSLDRNGSGNSNGKGITGRLPRIFTSVRAPAGELRTNNGAGGSTTEDGEFQDHYHHHHRGLKSQLGNSKVEQGTVIVVPDDRAGGEITEANGLAGPSIEETFPAWSWGFGSEAFQEISRDLTEREIAEGVAVTVADPLPHRAAIENFDGVQVSSSPVKRTRRAQLIDESFREAQLGSSSPKSVAGSSSKSSGSPMKSKRWGEGEEVPWLTDVRGDQDISESELEIYRHKHSKWNLGSCMRTAQMGIGSGSLLFLTHWILTAPTALPRWEGRSTQLSWVSIFSMIFGSVAATEYPRILCLRRTQGVVFWLLAALGASLLMFSNTSFGAMLGGALLAFAAPSLWISTAQCNLQKYPGSGLGITASVYILYVLWSTSLVAYQALPGLRFLRGTRAVLMGVAVAGVGLGVAREPMIASKERAAHGGIWRGLFTSEIDARGRQAVGALIIMAAIISSVAFGLRLHHHAHPSSPEQGSPLKVLNFNVQQGFSRAGATNYNAVLSVLRKEKPHVAMLQETDLMHIAHGNLDMINYWTTRLRIYSLYTPGTKSDSWGCAILSYYPFVHSESGVLKSPRGENACYQYAQVEVDGKTLHLVNTHFGTIEEEIVLQAEQLANITRRILSSSGGLEKVWLVLGGDLNAAPLTVSYNQTILAGLEDTYVSQNGQWKSSSDRDPGAGYVFSSPNLNCTSWAEPQYDQQETSDGYPIVATFDFT